MDQIRKDRLKLSISNIAWSTENDIEMYRFLQETGFQGLEIAPTRIFPHNPYNHVSEARIWAEKLKDNYSLVIPSMQSIWHGHSEQIFGSAEERKILIEYTRKSIDFAEAIGCKNLVFGNPKNRDTNEVDSVMPIAIDFFKEIGDYAAEHNTVIALEANPIIYNTHFMNYTYQAVEMAYKANSAGIRVNVDLGTIIHNEEDVYSLKQISEYINHVHISEPFLNQIEPKKIHQQLFTILKDMDYSGFVSIEMANKGDIQKVKETIKYIKSCN